MAARVLTLSAAAGLLLAGVYEARDVGVSAALFAAGFIVLGVWLGVEVLRKGDDDGEE